MDHLSSAKHKVTRCALAVVLALSSLVGVVLPKQAQAAETVAFTSGARISYGGYYTTYMEADGAMAYCGDPASTTPPPGNYEKSELVAISGRTQETIADLWFSYGSVGFDQSLWPSTWYDGSPMSDMRYAALAHILLADTFSSNGSYALFGCDEGFKSWCRQEVIGFGTDGREINPNATGRKIYKRMNEVPENFEAFMLHTGPGNQIILSHKYIPYGSLDVQKVTLRHEMTNDNPCYSLAGAVYTVYSNEALSEVVGMITTGSTGQGALEDLMPGDYWVRETTPSPGYALDPAVYKVTVVSGETTRVNSDTVGEIPQSDPVGMLLGKVDADTTKSLAQGDATLDGALFTVRYYKGDFETVEDAEASGNPERTWVFKTDADGFAYLSQEYKYSGDPLYLQTNGDASIPLETVLIQETRAPLGYNLDDGHGNPPKVFCIRITKDGSIGEAVYTYNSPVSPDTVKKGDFRLVKEVATSIYDDEYPDMPQETERIVVPGVTFEIINDSDAAVVSPATGKEVDPGHVVCSITTDINGLATTKDGNAEVNGWKKPDGWSGALAYGTYIIHEVIPDDVASAFKTKWNKTLLPVPDWKVTIREEDQYDPPQLVNDRIPQTPLKIMKLDAETGQHIPLPCGFKIKGPDGQYITWTARYPETQVIDTFYANERGELTLPMLLEEGEYTLEEAEAPYGYVQELNGKTFTVGPEYKGWDDPLIVEFEDMPQKAMITVKKTDSETGEAVADSVYIIKAAETIQTGDGTIRAYEGEIVATLTTDQSGTATSPELYLGTYIVYEAKAKDGYALNVNETTVVLDYAGQEISVYDHEEDVTNAPTRIRVLKLDALDEEMPLAGATFRIWNDGGTLDEEFVTDKDGTIELSYLLHGTYHIQEIEAPEGYAITDIADDGNAMVVDFTVNDQGMVQWDASGEMVDNHTFIFTNTPKSMGTTATDGLSGTHEGQASDEFTIRDVIEYTGLIPGETYTAKGVLMNKATGEAALDDDGNEITAETTFVAESSCGTVEVNFTFSGASLAGKTFVAFESMMHEDEEYMVHADIDDVAQSVNIVDIETSAKDGETETHEGTLTEDGRLIDTVTFTGLTPGEPYKMFTTLVDKATGNPIPGSDGLPIVATTTFIPQEKDGTVDVEMKIDTTAFVGKDIVFYERLADADENIIAVHEDPFDEGQTIEFPDEPETPVIPDEPEDSDEPGESVTGKGYPKTGAGAPIAVSAAVLLICGSVGAGYALTKRLRARKDKPSITESEAVSEPDPISELDAH